MGKELKFAKEGIRERASKIRKNEKILRISIIGKHIMKRRRIAVHQAGRAGKGRVSMRSRHAKREHKNHTARREGFGETRSYRKSSMQC